MGLILVNFSGLSFGKAVEKLGDFFDCAAPEGRERVQVCMAVGATLRSRDANTGVERESCFAAFDA